MASLIDRRKMMALLSAKNWLNQTTISAIKSVFGDTEGADIVYRVNAYINNLDRSMRVTMASLVNEDPMFVCSLVSTTKDRKIVFLNADASTGRNNRFNTAVPLNTVGKVEMGIQRLTFTGRMGYIFITAQGSTPCCGIGHNSLGASFSPPLGTLDTVTDQTITFSTSNQSMTSFFLYGTNDTNWTDDCGCTYIKIYGLDLGTLLLYVVPFRHEGIMCFVDMITPGTFYYATGDTQPIEQITDKGTTAPYA